MLLSTSLNSTVVAASAGGQGKNGNGRGNNGFGNGGNDGSRNGKTDTNR